VTDYVHYNLTKQQNHSVLNLDYVFTKFDPEYQQLINRVYTMYVNYTSYCKWGANDIPIRIYLTLHPSLSARTSNETL